MSSSREKFEYGLLNEKPANPTVRNRSQSRSEPNPAPWTVETEKSGVRPLSAVPCAEKDDAYPAVVARLNSDWRIIECRDGIQWILQRRKGQSSGCPEWRGKCFCRTLAGLLLSIRENCGRVNADATAIVRNLPERLGEAQ